MKFIRPGNNMDYTGRACKKKSKTTSSTIMKRNITVSQRCYILNYLKERDERERREKREREREREER